MAGATNRAMKAAGLPKATQEKIRVARGAGLTVQSAIQHAQAHGLPLGKAAKHVGELSGWQKAAAGAKVEARPATKRAPGESLEAYRARDLTSRDPATMRAAIREQIKKIRSDAGGEADVQRLSTMLQSRNAAAKQRTAERGGQQDLFGANPAPRGPSPFEVRAKAAAERRAAMVASAQQRAGRLPQALGGAARGMMAARKAAAAKPTLERSMSKFKAHAQGVINDYYKANFPKQTPPTLHYSDGEKYIRVTRVDAGSKTGSAHAFIDKATGDVLKPDGYKRPAKGARGNIHTGDFGVNEHGANYSAAYMKRSGAMGFYAPPRRGPSKRERQANADARDVIMGPRR